MTTPARKQYLDIKSKHREEILLFRMGDFYETFDEDAKIISRELEITLTSREMGKGKKVPLAGIPYHSLETYLAKLISRDYKVAICEQIGDPAASKGIVERKVLRIVTPGTVFEDNLLQSETNNYLASLVIRGDEAGIAYVDITTSEFATTQIPMSRAQAEIERLAPRELLLTESSENEIKIDVSVAKSTVSEHHFHPKWSIQVLMDHFAIETLEPFGCHKLPLAAQAAGAIIEYIKDHQGRALPGLKLLKTYSTDSFMVVDEQTRRNLELFNGGRWDSKSASLYSILDQTSTPMGSRMLKRWIGQPLLKIDTLTSRQDAVEWFTESIFRRNNSVDLLKSMSDLERLATKVTGGNATPRDLSGISKTLEIIPKLCEFLKTNGDSQQVEWISRKFADNSNISDLLKLSLSEDPPTSVGDGRTIKHGFSEQLDSIREESKIAVESMSSVQLRERERTGIKSLKVGYNRVFGYYIEVSKANLNVVPPDYMRRQTLVGAERFITPGMKDKEAVILNAKDRIEEIETQIFKQLCTQISQQASLLLKSAEAVALVDVFCSLASVASDRDYARPTLNNESVIEIEDGRHPIIEQIVETGSFISNHAKLDLTDSQIMILTGPNMSGKSTYLRQIGLITLMAQIGSFVPATSATIGVVDRIFTRVGLQDDLTVGQSTFMVEMVETASILNQASRNSLIILDEIGRGTSTYDGLAIAKSVVEYIHNHPKLGCKTLFATHYHEMIDLAHSLPRVRNHHVPVIEEGGNIVFLRRVTPGGSNKSYGVHVARLAGLPTGVINRAWELLKDLENKTSSKPQNLGIQLSLIKENSPLIKELHDLDIASITPLEAITKLYEYQARSREE